MNIIFCTSFGEPYYDKVARYTLPHLVKSTRQHKLSVFYENRITLEPNINPSNVQYLNLFHCSPELVKFLNEIADDKTTHGKEPTDNNKHMWLPDQLEKGYNYMYNAFVFCRKWFALRYAYMQLMRQYEDFVLVWVDADILLHDYLDDIDKHINEVFNDNQKIAYVARNYIHSECGFMMFKSSGQAFDVINNVCEFYARHKVFDYEQWHDSYVFDIVREHMDAKYFTAISTGSYGEDAFFKSFMGDYASHLKGRVKNQVQEVINTGRQVKTVLKSA